MSWYSYCWFLWQLWYTTYWDTIIIFQMISFLFSMAGLLNLLFYVFAIGFLISLGLEQWIKFKPLSVDASMNERNMYIVQTNRKYCWRQAWVVNLLWFMCNIGLYLASRNMQTPVDTFWQGLWRRKNQKKESMLRIEWNTLESSIELSHQLWS